MDLIYTVFASVILVFYSGYLFKGRHESELSALLAKSFLYSMVFVWAMFLLTYVTDPSKFVLLLILVSTCAIFLIFGKNHAHPISAPVSKAQWQTPELGILGAVIIFALTIAAGSYVYVDRFYEPVFTLWDAVVSFNGWAIAMANGEFEGAGGAAYPLLYPGLWSLIYRVQGDVDFWLLSKGTMLVAPVILWLYAFALSVERRSIFPMLFLTVCCGLVIFRTEHFLQGTMDLPVVILGTWTCLILWSECTDTQNKSSNTSLLASGVAMLVKQPGLLFFLLVSIVKIVEAKGIREFYRAHARMILIGVSLVASFALIYVYNHNWMVIPRALAGLRGVAQNAAGDLSLSEHAYQLVTQFLSWALLAPVLIFSLVSFFYAPKRLKVVSVVSFALGTLGFFLWMNIASYDVRNLLWVFIMMGFSASIGLTAVLNKIGLQAIEFCNSRNYQFQNKKVTLPGSAKHIRFVILLMPLAVAGALAFTGMDRLQEINNTARNNIIPMGLRGIFSDERLQQKPNFSVITNIQTLAWVPKLEGHVYIHTMHAAGYEQLRDRILTKQDTILVLKKVPRAKDGTSPILRRLETEGLIARVEENMLYVVFALNR